jgi:hypothetical protein
MTERHVRADARVVLRAASILLLVGALVAHPALAANRPQVTVYGSPSDPVVLRLVPELTALGCVVQIDASPTPDPAAPMDRDAVLRVAATTVTLWFSDPRSGRPREGGTVGIDDRGPEGSELTAVRVSEIVRAQLLPVESGAASSRGEPGATLLAADGSALAPLRDAAADSPAPEATVQAAASADRGAGAAQTPSPPAPAGAHRDDASSEVAPRVVSHGPRLSASLGSILLLAPGGTKPALDLTLSPEWYPSSNLRIRALLAAPLTTPSIVATGGEATVSTWLAGAAIDWQTSSGDDNWRGTLGAGVAGVLSRAQGTATAPYVGSTTNAIAALPFIEVGGSRSLGVSWVHLGVGGMLGVALPEIVIQFASLRVATWGLPVVGALSLALDVDLW